MMEDKPPPIFTCDGHVVGEFKDGYPAETGKFRYMPYRGPGHYRLGIKMRDEGSAVCTFTNGSEMYTMLITACPKYGVLTAGELKQET